MVNHIVAEFIPDEKYTRHSEGAFLRLKDGRILFVYSRFTNSSEDDAPSDLVACYSSDEGETWTEPEVCIPASMYGVDNVMSVSLMRMLNGDVGLFYIVKQDVYHTRIILSRSSDEGKTYYKHVDCTSFGIKGYYTLNNDRMVRLQSGRLLMPLAYHRGSFQRELGQWDKRTFTCFLYSDDDGDTWKESADVVYPSFQDTNAGLQEPGAIQKKNGAIWAWARTDRMYQYETFSTDEGIHWTVAQPSYFTSPQSPLQIVRRPQTGDLYAIWNPQPLWVGRVRSKAGWGRTPFVWAVSTDDGVTWSDCHVIEDEAEHGYCYPGVFFTDDGAMLVSYCSGGPEEGSCLARTTIMKIAI